MASTLKEFEDILLGFVSRNLTSLQVGVGTPTNLVRTAINNAITYAQRKIDFEWNKAFVYVSCDPTGNVLTGFKKVSDDSVIKVKQFDQAYLRDETTQQYYPIDSTSKATLSRHVQKQLDTNNIEVSQTNDVTSWSRVIQFGQDIELYPRPSTTPYLLWFDAVVWLPQLSADDDTNFLLEYAHDYILYRSLVELNFFLKEDDRFDINKQLLQDAYTSLKDWNARLVAPNETEVDL